MKHASSTLLTRLALALLAVLGFVAPLCAAEGDRVVQTCGGKPPPEVKVERCAPPRVHSVEAKAAAEPWRSVPRVESAARRYLLNRAWLV